MTQSQDRAKLVQTLDLFRGQSEPTGMNTKLSAKAQRDLDHAFSDAQRVQRMTAEEAATLPGLLGRVASAMLTTRGWYAFTDAAEGERVLIVRADLA